MRLHSLFIILSNPLYPLIIVATVAIADTTAYFGGKLLGKTKILPKVKPDVKFKSTAVKKKIDGKDTKTGHYRFWSVVGLGYKAAVKNLNNAYEDYENGELLQEGFFDKAKKIFKRFQQFLSRVFMKMKQFITASVNNMAEFLGVEPIIKFNNNVKW